MNFGAKIVDRFLGDPSERLAAEAFKRAKDEESRVGAKVFGTVPKGTRREFFCLDERTWVWHEEWVENSVRQVRTVRYEIRPYGVFTSLNGSEYQPINREDGQNFIAAIDRYNEIIDDELQPVLGQFAA